jgi:hypothetical protein
MNNICKLLTVMTVLGTFCTNAMQMRLSGEVNNNCSFSFSNSKTVVDSLGAEHKVSFSVIVREDENGNPSVDIGLPMIDGKTHDRNGRLSFLQDGTAEFTANEDIVDVGDITWDEANKQMTFGYLERSGFDSSYNLKSDFGATLTVDCSALQVTRRNAQEEDFNGGTFSRRLPMRLSSEKTEFFRCGGFECINVSGKKVYLSLNLERGSDERYTGRIRLMAERSEPLYTATFTLEDFQVVGYTVEFCSEPMRQNGVLPGTYFTGSVLNITAQEGAYGGVVYGSFNLDLSNWARFLLIFASHSFFGPFRILFSSSPPLSSLIPPTLSSAYPAFWR